MPSGLSKLATAATAPRPEASLGLQLKVRACLNLRLRLSGATFTSSVNKGALVPKSSKVTAATEKISSPKAPPKSTPGSKISKPPTATKTYVLDTSVLLSDPRALFKFHEHEVVIPIIVINELEKKRNDPEIGYYARQALRHLDDLRVKHERLDLSLIHI